MAIHPNGEIVVPPTCPQHSIGAAIPDLRKADFHIGVYTMDNRPNPIVEAVASFIVGNPEEDDPYSRVDTEMITESRASALAARLQGLESASPESDPRAKTVEPKEGSPAERIRQTLCGRVAVCHGVVDGECWALGNAGFRATLAEVLQPESEA